MMFIKFDVTLVKAMLLWFTRKIFFAIISRVDVVVALNALDVGQSRFYLMWYVGWLFNRATSLTRKAKTTICTSNETKFNIIPTTTLINGICSSNHIQYIVSLNNVKCSGGQIKFRRAHFVSEELAPDEGRFRNRYPQKVFSRDSS